MIDYRSRVTLPSWFSFGYYDDSSDEMIHIELVRSVWSPIVLTRSIDSWCLVGGISDTDWSFTDGVDVLVAIGDDYCDDCQWWECITLVS